MNNKYINIKAYGSEEQLGRLIQLLRTMEVLGGMGCTRTLKVWYDGDGAARMKFDFGDTDVTNVQIPDRNGELRFDFE